MTQTISFGAKLNTADNPLFHKMRRRFSYQGNRTIAEVMVQRAIRDGYGMNAGSAKPVRDFENTAQRRTLSEEQIVRANSLPRTSMDTNRMRRDSVRTVPAKRVSDDGITCSRADAASASARLSAPKPVAKTPARKQSPAGILCVIILCASLMMFLVYSGIQMSSLSREVSSLRSDASALKSEAAALTVKLEEKNDMKTIEEIATGSLGMVPRYAVEHVYIGAYTDDNAEVYQPKSDNTLLANLLNAFTESFH